MIRCAKSIDLGVAWPAGRTCSTVAYHLLWGFSVLLLLASCDRMVTPRNTQTIKDAETQSSQGNFSAAINLYETALDGTPGTADIHYKLALLYDDKMNDQLNALHHFKRYLTLKPNGPHAGEVRDFMKRDEIALVTNLSGDAVVSRADAARLRNDNLNLRKQIEERSAKPRASEEKSAPEKARSEQTASKKNGNQTYVVQRGDTLFSIARKFYKSSSRWKEIRDANKSKLEKPADLQPGQTLIIP